LKQDQIPVFVSSAARAPIKIFSELDSGDVNIHSGAADFSIHFGPERIFTSRRNPYSHHPGTNIHMPRNPHMLLNRGRGYTNMHYLSALKSEADCVY
jgi:hypothetical protein